jgi:hypothetical protein
MTIGRWAAIPALPLLALVLAAAGPSVGDRMADSGAATPPQVPASVTCQDDSAVLVAAGGASRVMFRCVDGVPVPREGPWSNPGCIKPDYATETMLLGASGGAWQPDTACYVAATPGFAATSGAMATRLGR